MYLEHLGLKEYPFSLASDPKFLYLSKSHARVKAQIEYALYVQDSLLVFTGEIGSGKTTMLHDALAKFDDNNIIVAKIHQTQINEIEFLQLLLVEFGFELFNAAKVELLNKISKYLKEQFHAGKKVLLVILLHHFPEKFLKIIIFLRAHTDMLPNIRYGNISISIPEYKDQILTLLSETFDIFPITSHIDRHHLPIKDVFLLIGF